MIQNILVIAIPTLALLMLAEGMMGKKRSATVGQFFLMDGKLPYWPYVGSFAATNFSLGNVIFLGLI